MMDKTELNPLILGVRWSAEAIDAAMTNVVDYFNVMNPPSSQKYTVESFPYRYLMLMGSAGYLLKSAAINEAANQLSYAADGVQINDKDKAQIFISMGTEYWNEFKEAAHDIKLNQNIAEVYGTKHSEYIHRRRW